MIGKRVRVVDNCCSKIEGIVIGYYSDTEVLVQQLKGDPVSVFINQLEIINDKMETKLFTCNSQEQVDDYIFVYYQCILKKDLGHWKKGTMIEKVSINIFSGYLYILDNSNQPVDTFKVLLDVA